MYIFIKVLKNFRGYEIIWVTESDSLLGSLLEEGGEYLLEYHSEGWIDD